MKVEELILYAFNKIGFVFSEETLRAAKYAEALFYLNEEVSALNRSGGTCAFYTEVPFTFVSGQQDYTFGLADSDVITEPFTEVEYVQILWNGIYYSIAPETRKQRLAGITYPQPYEAIPWEVLFKRNRLQAILSFYQIPALELPAIVYGKQEIPKFVPLMDITNLPEYYLYYMRLKCAKKLAAQYTGNTWTDDDEIELGRARNDVFSAPEVNVDIINSPLLLDNSSDAVGLAAIYGGV